MLFDIFKQLLVVATTTPAFKAQNIVLQDAGFAASISDHLSALSADVNIQLTSDDVLITTDNVINDLTSRDIVFLSGESFPEDEYATFNALNFAVNVSIGGYIAQSDLPNEAIVVEYRTAETSPWHYLNQLDSVPGSKYLQFRTRIASGAPIANHVLKKIVIIGRQE